MGQREAGRAKQGIPTQINVCGGEQRPEREQGESVTGDKPREGREGC